MAAYKDEQRGTWYVSFHYYDWTGKNCRKVKRRFKTKREATEWERHFRMKEAADLDMTFEDFVPAGIHFQKVDTQPSGLYRYSLRLPNQPNHKSPPNGQTDFLKGFPGGRPGPKEASSIALPQ